MLETTALARRVPDYSIVRLFPVELTARWLRETDPEKPAREALVITTFPEHITSEDVGRKVASVMGCDWEWRTPPKGTVVVAVQPRYGFPGGVAVAIEAPGWERPLWYDATAIRLLPLDRKESDYERLAAEEPVTAPADSRAAAGIP
jgi:hypothetical protein